MVLTNFLFFYLKYSNIINKLLNTALTPSFLFKINIWSFLNIKFFFFKSYSFIFFFLTNLKNFKIKFLKLNNYINLNFFYLVLMSLIFFLFLI